MMEFLSFDLILVMFHAFLKVFLLSDPNMVYWSPLHIQRIHSVDLSYLLMSIEIHQFENFANHFQEHD